MGLDVTLYKHAGDLDGEVDLAYETRIQQKSAKHPDHLFEIGYWRSSYNAGGIDRILSDRIGVTLADIAGAGDAYLFRPDWRATRRRAIEAREKLIEYREKYGDFRVVCAHSSHVVRSETEALSIFQKERGWVAQKKGQGFDSYSNREGFFAKEPLKVHAILTGVDILGAPCAYAVYEADGMSWYVDALEVVVETCDYVLAQPDTKDYLLSWSG